MKWPLIAGAALVLVLVDAFFIVYVTSYGLGAKAQNIALGGAGVSIPLQWVPLLGVLLLSFVTWYEAYYRVFPKRGAFEIDPLARLRLLRAVVFSLAVFVLVLYVPYLIGSNWFWARMSETGRSITQVHDFGLSLLNSVQSMMLMNQLWQYSLSQSLAAAAMILGAWAFARSGRRQKKSR
jgi:hypothetical protein